MKINYFDFGLHKGDEVLMFLEAVKPLNAPVSVYGFEAHPELAQKASDRYKGSDNIQIINKAISNCNSKVRLYIAEGNKMEGNSIFKTKNNVNPDNFIEVEGVKFSDWIKSNIPNYKEFINVVRFNIEGAEIHLIDDLIESGISEHINLYLGSKGGEDILKCSEIKHLHGSYVEKLVENNIEVHQFCVVSTDNISYERIQKIVDDGWGRWK